MLDGQDSTHYTSAMAQREGDWIGIDLRAIRRVPKVQIWQGRNSVDDVDFLTTPPYSIRQMARSGIHLFLS